MNFKDAKIFVASSSERIEYAEAFQMNLNDFAQVKLWTQGVFQIGQIFIDELINELKRSDFGVFIFAPDDVVTIRHSRQKAVRDNVVLELGMYLGRLGRERSFIIKPKGVELRLPTDLLGIVAGEYDGERTDLQGALGSCCAQIKKAVEKQFHKRNDELNKIVKVALETICRAVSIPVRPEKVGLRAFIFRKENNELVCKHYWDPDESSVEVGLRFPIDKRNAKKVIVVRCFLDNETSRSEVQPLPKEIDYQGAVKESLRYVLAAPIHKEDGSLWGVVDFDTTTRDGQTLLRSQIAQQVIFQLARHLRSVLRVG